MGDLERDTEPEALGEGRYAARLDSDWEIWGPNGGYLAVIALRAAGREARIARPASFGCHFLRTAKFEPVELSVTVLRAGRRAESIRVSMEQQGRLVLEAWLRTAHEGEGLEHDVVDVPDVPGPDGLPEIDDLRPKDVPNHAFWDNLAERMVRPPPKQWGVREERPPVWRNWYRFRPRATFDDPWVDAGRLVLLLDTLSWPAAVGPHPETAMIAPNLDLTVWFHDFDPASEWLLTDHDVPLARGGMMGTQGRVFSESRRLLASGGAQLLCAPPPPTS